MDGYIKLHRKLFENKYYFKQKFTYSQAWTDLLLLAKEKDDYVQKRGMRIMLKRGQIGEGIETLATRWKWSRGKVKRFINELKTDHQIEHQNIDVTTLISIVNYDKYNSSSTLERTLNDTPENSANGTLKDVPKTRPNNYALFTEIADQAVIWPTFEDFWHEYDKKVGRPKAEQKWNNLSQVEKEKIMHYIPLYKNAQPDKQYRKNPESFFNNKIWNDEIISTNGTINKREQTINKLLRPI